MNPKDDLNPIDPSEQGNSQGELGENRSVDDFLTRLTHDIRRPKPGQEAIAAALQAVQRLALEADSEQLAETQSLVGNLCPSCGAANRPQNRFCASCGVSLPQPLLPPAEDRPPSRVQETALQVEAAPLPAGQHHYHHHYHYFTSQDGVLPGAAPDVRPSGAAPRDTGRLRSPVGGPSLSRAETAVRKLTQDWALACNTKQLDDLIDLYAADALVLRPNVPAVRGTAAIREFFFSALDAGLGEVELEPIRVELLGEVAYEAGRFKMLVPAAVGRRREERGKYLLVFSRQANGDWKAVSDCWSSDLSLGIATETPAAPPSKPSRRT